MPKLNHAKTKRALLALLVFGHAENSFAVDAGQQLNQIERIQDQAEPLKSLPTIESDKPLVKPQQDGFRTQIKQFVFEGNRLFSSAQLQAYIKEYLNRDITFDELKLAVDGITLFYKEQGYLATATLPKQDISEGNVRIIIVEAKFGGAKIDGDTDKSYRVYPSIIKRFIEANNPLDQALNLNALDRAVLIANELPGVSVSQSLQKGSQAGQVESLVKLGNRAGYVVSATADNYGFKSTGRDRYLGSAALFSPTGIGDRVDLTYLHTDGNDYGRLAYARPIGYSGLNLGINGSALKYQVVTGAGLSSQLQGTAETLEIQASYPTIKTRGLSLTNSASIEAKHFKNTSTDGLESDYMVNVASVGGALNHRNSLTLAGESSAALDVDLGYTDYDKSPTDFAVPKANSRVDGQFARLRWNLINTQFYTETIRSVVKFNGQLADSNLDSSQKFYLGGATGIRAYPSSEGGGSNGFLINLELHKELPGNFTVTGFYDYGHAKQYVDNSYKTNGNSITVDGEKNSFNMKGYGASLEWRGDFAKFRPTVSLVWSKRIGHNPNPQSDGSDSDGSQPGDFYWVNGSINF